MEIHPFIWYISWFLVHRCSFLLPHDKSYFALRHFSSNHENNLFLDIGANAGISALSFRRLNKKMPIYSIEPNSIHRKSLENLKKKLISFDFLLKGVGDAEGQLSFYTPIYKGIVLHTFTSSSEAQVRLAVRQSFGALVEKQLIIRESIVAVVRVDQLDLKPSIIKIDAEGFDYHVLLGAEQTIKQSGPFVMIEACHGNIGDVHSFFAELSYELLTYDDKADNFSILKQGFLDSIIGVKNVFAIPQEKLRLLPIK